MKEHLDIFERDKNKHKQCASNRIYLCSFGKRSSASYLNTIKYK